MGDFACMMTSRLHLMQIRFIACQHALCNNAGTYENMQLADVIDRLTGPSAVARSLLGVAVEKSKDS